jgi:hypothetical protein
VKRSKLYLCNCPTCCTFSLVLHKSLVSVGKKNINFFRALRVVCVRNIQLSLWPISCFRICSNICIKYPFLNAYTRHNCDARATTFNLPSFEFSHPVTEFSLLPIVTTTVGRCLPQTSLDSSPSYRECYKVSVLKTANETGRVRSRVRVPMEWSFKFTQSFWPH